MPHTHDCIGCQAAIDCGGRWERNHDGWPAAICSHEDGIGEWLCDECREHTCQSGEADDCQRYRATEAYTFGLVCRPCRRWHAADDALSVA